MRLYTYKTSLTPCRALLPDIITVDRILEKINYHFHDRNKSLLNFMAVFFGAEAIFQIVLSSKKIQDLNKKPIDQGTILEELTILAETIVKVKAVALVACGGRVSGSESIQVGAEVFNIAGLFYSADALIQSLETYMHPPTP